MKKPKRFIITGLWVCLGVVVVVLIALIAYSSQLAGPSGPPLAVAVLSPTAPATPAAVVTPVSPAPLPFESLPPLTPPAGGVSLSVTPAAEGIGWTSSLDGRSHLGFPNIHAGVLEGHIYQGVLQFDLSAIPAGATFTYAVLELMALDSQNLGQTGTWQLRLLDPAVQTTWMAGLTYEGLRQAGVLATIPPALSPAELARSRNHVFAFEAGQLAMLSRLAGGVVSFRLDGPMAGEDSLFTWDSGYRGEEASGSGPRLHLAALLPATPAFVLVTSTPTPENAITAAALAATATEVAAATGTYTPVPANWVTPAVVTPPPTPANTATAAYQAEVATAEAFLYGSATPTPANVWTATPTATPPATSGATPEYTSTATGQVALQWVIVTSTPTPENVITAAALAATATEVAAITGTYTPVPADWVTPVVVTPPPTPANTATAAYQVAVATAEAFLYGSPTPTPANVWTVTPTPLFVLVEGDIATPWATWTPTTTPLPIPAELVGKIAFLSNRSGGPEPLKEPLVYLVDPDGSNLAVLSNRAIYEAAVARDSFSADQRFRAFTKNALRFDGKQVPALYFYDYFYEVEEQITNFGAGIAYEPAWSPNGEQITFVSNDSGNDEIWVIQRDGSGVMQLTRDERHWWDKHPSWSPDGSQIVFWSNRTGRRQIWVMNPDGSNLHSLSRTGYDDWDPIWIKYTDPARNP